MVVVVVFLPGRRSAVDACCAAAEAGPDAPSPWGRPASARTSRTHTQSSHQSAVGKDTIHQDRAVFLVMKKARVGWVIRRIQIGVVVRDH